ncbi:penicillin-binding protein [Candidatus Peregrinibacteria bacterium]|jgi:membrane peptidoglycan carboxypeptidase|nr:penicillin-binding protein [Candidatus Peregrinibacteria bacterium]MBT4631751.1 penicillin-binding protein [Candidatus Peregrinibacteria bacterium]MBT5517239.1 penicillin-binding protein [Candidatus Peregrinibacteria bacterium]MBT5824524.1 penicillin-binding protein [Candidatus Peregrinibacteria bacterium]
MKNWTKKKISKAWRKLKPKPHMSKKKKAFLHLLRLAITGALVLTACMFIYVVYLLFTLPNPSELRDLNLTESTLIMDREGNLLYAIHGEENRKALDDIQDISPWLIDATVAIEDDKFYKHIGIDLPGLFKAFLSEIGIGSPRGGSTITQQFVKNTFLSSERTYTRKLQEIVLSLSVELRFNKEEIMLMYLNAIPYGSNAYGIELAAERYFEKEASELTLSESAILASIPKAPTRYSPYGNYRYTTLHFDLNEETLGDRKITGEGDLEYEEWTRGLIGKEFTMPDGSTFYIKGRSELVLDRMEELKLISSAQKEEAVSEVKEIAFTPYIETIKAPHFVLWVKQMLEEKYGVAVVEQGGLKVYTTIDPDYQKASEDAIHERWQHNVDNYNADNAAMVSIHPQTGQILSMVGSSSYYDTEDIQVVDGQVNMITSTRQPGSSFKPFVYALAFLNQYSPATVLYDVATDFGYNYKPANYDGQFMGPLSMRRALAQSRNIPAVKAYFLAGLEEALVPFVKEFGMESVREEANYGSSMALGTADITALELAEAYTVFANGGYKVEPTPILKIENANGEVLEQWEERNVIKDNVLDEQVAFLINDILSDPSVGLGPSVRIDSLDNAAKTGTSTNPDGKATNAWLAAYTPNLVTITWAGNARNNAMSASAGGYNTAAPIWKSFMTNILDRIEPTNWKRPEEIVEKAVSTASGQIPSDSTPSDMIATEVFASFAVPTGLDNSFVTLMIETITNRLATEHSPADAVEEKSFRIHVSVLADVWTKWQDAINIWAEENDEGQPPTEDASSIHNERNASRLPEIAIVDPLSLTSYDKDTKLIDVEIEILEQGNGVNHVKFLLDGDQQFEAKNSPFTGKIRIPTSAQDGDILEIEAKGVDVYGYSSSSKIQIRIGEAKSKKDPEPEPEIDEPEDAVLEDDES